jgi:hypothetical protein
MLNKERLLHSSEQAFVFGSDVRFVTALSKDMNSVQLLNEVQLGIAKRSTSATLHRQFRCRFWHLQTKQKWTEPILPSYKQRR